MLGSKDYFLGTIMLRHYVTIPTWASLAQKLDCRVENHYHVVF